MSQKEFAEYVGSSPAQVNQYLKTDREPGTPFLRGLALKGINLNWLLTGEGEMYIEKKEARIPAELQAYLKELEQEGVDVVQLVAEVRAFRAFKRGLVEQQAQWKAAPAASKNKEAKAEPTSSAKKKRK